MRIVDKNGKKYVIPLSSFLLISFTKRKNALKVANIIKKHNPNVGIDI